MGEETKRNLESQPNKVLRKTCRINLNEIKDIQSEEKSSLTNCLLIVDGVELAFFEKNILCVTYSPEVVGIRDLINAVIQAGFIRANFIKNET